MNREFVKISWLFSITLMGCNQTQEHARRPTLDAGTTTAAPATATTTTSCDKAETPQARALVERYCVSCHSPGGDAGDEHDFTQPQLLRGQHRAISARLRAHSMPPRTSSQPTLAELTLLLHWADCGADVAPQSLSLAQGVLETR